MQNNARQHTALASFGFGTMASPVRSSNHKPIELIWNMLGKLRYYPNRLKSFDEIYHNSIEVEIVNIK